MINSNPTREYFLPPNLSMTEVSYLQFSFAFHYIFLLKMVEATTELNYNNIANNVKATTVTIPANIAVETPNDFNAIAASCNTNVCFFCQKIFTNVYNCRRHIRTHSGEKPYVHCSNYIFKSHKSRVLLNFTGSLATYAEKSSVVNRLWTRTKRWISDFILNSMTITHCSKS